MKRKIINRDKNGNIIKDMSKVTLSKELSLEILKIYENYENEFCTDSIDKEGKSKS